MKIAYDITLMKVGCPLLQAGMGGAEPSLISQHFDPEYWLLAPTPNLKVYEITEDKFLQLVWKTHQYHEKQNS